MGKRPTLLPAKDMRAKFEHVRARRADLALGATYDTVVIAMKKLAATVAPSAAQGLNRMINGGDPANQHWLTQLSQVFDLPSVRWEDWYDASDGDFFDKVDRHICHDPVDVLARRADPSPDLGLQVARTAPLWQHQTPPLPVVIPIPADRAIEVGTPRRRPRTVTTTAPGDGIVVSATLPFESSVELLNIDNPDGADARAYVLTGFLDISDAMTIAGKTEIRMQTGAPIPVGGTYRGPSRLVLVASTTPVARRWRPESDGLVALRDLRDFVIAVMRHPEAECLVMTADYRTIDVTP